MRPLGDPPRDPRKTTAWRRHARTVAAYRDRYGITDDSPLGPEPENAAQKIDAAEMLRIGYLTQATSADRLDAEVDTLAKILAGNAPKAMRGMKRAVNAVLRGTFDPAEVEARYRESLRGDEIKEGVAAFGEKRAPKF